MKKILLAAAIAITLSSCKKEQPAPIYTRADQCPNERTDTIFIGWNATNKSVTYNLNYRYSPNDPWINIKGLPPNSKHYIINTFCDCTQDNGSQGFQIDIHDFNISTLNSNDTTTVDCYLIFKNDTIKTFPNATSWTRTNDCY
jgi:hypothetical protein